GEIAVERPVYIMPIVDVDIAGIVAQGGTVVINVKPSDPTDPSVVIMDFHIADLGDAPIIVIVYGDVLHLDHGPIVIVLDKGIVVITGVEGDSHIADLGTDSNIDPIVHIKIKFTIRIYREGHPVLHKDE